LQVLSLPHQGSTALAHALQENKIPPEKMVSKLEEHNNQNATINQYILLALTPLRRKH